MPGCFNCHYSPAPCTYLGVKSLDICDCCGIDIAEQNKSTDQHQRKLKELICSDKYISQFGSQSCELSKLVQ